MRSVIFARALRRFYFSLLRLFGRRGTMTLNFVTVGGRRIACLFTMEDARTLFALKIGYDPSYAAISPGHLMVAETAADAERRGLQVFDFIGNESEWKLKWTRRSREHLRVTVLRPSSGAYEIRRAQGAGTWHRRKPGHAPATGVLPQGPRRVVEPLCISSRHCLTYGI